jgi:hypothetical protein
VGRASAPHITSPLLGRAGRKGWQRDYGGGGLGGPSAGIAYFVGLPVVLHDTAIKMGVPAKGP